MIEVDVLTLEQWVPYADIAFESVFGYKNAKLHNDFNFVVFAHEKGRPIGFVTCQIHDADTVYLKHGGILPEHRGFQTKKLYAETIRGLNKKFKNIITFIENTNIAMLKLSLSEDFKIVGIRNYNNIILVELLRS